MTGCVGTPLFSSPEQLGHRRYDGSVDVWATGCVLVCLLHDSRTPYARRIRRILSRFHRRFRRTHARLNAAAAIPLHADTHSQAYRRPPAPSTLSPCPGRYLDEPFEGAETLLGRIARGEVTPSARPDSTLRALVGACCAYEPAERISAARLAEELVKMLAASKLAPHQ